MSTFNLITHVATTGKSIEIKSILFCLDLILIQLKILYLFQIIQGNTHNE